jgi:hypothetical protein
MPPEAQPASTMEAGPAVRVDAVVTHHRSGLRSGVARFNELLAEHLGVPLLGLQERLGDLACPLLSFKASELGEPEAAAVAELVDNPPWRWELFLHEFAGLELERRLVEGAQRVHCGNHEIVAAVSELNPATDELWTPGLVLDDRPFQPSEISVFSFGMAHKIRTDMFRRLRSLLDASGKTYAVYVSAANHETASLRDAQLIFEEMHDVFPRSLYFLGNLSDVAVSNWLTQTTFFAAFFVGGVRGNNTSVASAMERGAIVITNLDEHSPREFVHMDNVIDLERCDELPSDPQVLERLSARARETGRARGWDRLAERIR